MKTFIILTLLFTLTKAFAGDSTGVQLKNDTIKLETPTSVFFIDKDSYVSGLMENKTILTPGFSINGGLFTYFRMNDITNAKVITSSPSFNRIWKFINCNFDTYLSDYDSERKFEKAIVDQDISFEKCNIRSLILTNHVSDISISDSKIGRIYIDSCENSTISLSNDSLFINRNPSIWINNCKSIQLSFNYITQLKSDAVKVNNSIIEYVYIRPTITSSSICHFINDTINNTFESELVEEDFYSLEKRHIPKDTFEHKFSFKDCYINASFIIPGKIYNCHLAFENCTFGPLANLTNLSVNKIEFINCKNIPQQLRLSFNSNKDEIEIRMVETDPSNIRFDFPKNAKLVFDSTERLDDTINSFTKLLEKFRSENRQESYKNVDILYKKSTEGSFVNFIERIWWYYGYEKQYVIYWCLLFILIFTIVNLIIWQKIKEAYSLIEDEYYSSSEQKDAKWRITARQILKVLIFTSVLFFSLHISYEKISYKKGSVVLWIAFQYVTGLICLFFVLNYILKG